MKLKDIGEFGWIRRIGNGCLIRPANVVRAIGDDAAAFTLPPGEVTLVTTDLLAEGVHFLRHATSGFNLGHKALAVNLSDIAAMGGTAREAFVSIAIPKDCDVDFLDDVYRGMKALARRFDVNILGGDTTHSRSGLIINITVVGSVPEAEMCRRDRAAAGDVICITGLPGESRAGLHLILNDIPAESPIGSDDFRTLFDAHVLPRPHLEEGRFLATQNGVHAAIDVSDGVSSDLGHIVRESGVGIRLYADQIPISGPLRRFCERFGFDPVPYALSGGRIMCCSAPYRPNRPKPFAGRFRRASTGPSSPSAISPTPGHPSWCWRTAAAFPSTPPAGTTSKPDRPPPCRGGDMLFPRKSRTSVGTENVPALRI
ncbi:thiamine-phosphate kinase [Desulfonema ishimotonii]|uniref:Thiamine-monophosphate kinase n=1 Tax=Desulfonema ishimotonii TaxID=45657 RepID=A0A401G0I2_9BACT|nr:thiamine-phosphate kinase [Desulfonema ishimotonii]GBC62728.1 thiamine-phosphate kinase [Desulfonema ishimotonii]